MASNCFASDSSSTALSEHSEVGLSAHGVQDKCFDVKSRGLTSREAQSTRDDPALIHWPKDPAELQRRGQFAILLDIAEWTLVLTPALFIGLALAILAISGRPTYGSRIGPQIEAAMKLGPTIFPLMFAAVATRSLRLLSRYVCQQGTKLGILELLLASRSVWGTFQSQLLLRRCTVVGALLLTFWSLSPLGGQASLRALIRRDNVTRNFTTLRYLYTGPFATLLDVHSKSLQSRSGSAFLCELLASRDMQAAPRDSWGSVRVPRLEQLPGYNDSAAARRHEWLPVPAIAHVEQLSSLLGVPVAGLPAAAAAPNTTAAFALETSYMSLKCDAWATFPADDAAQLRRYQKDRAAANLSRIDDGMRATYFLDGDVPAAPTWREYLASARDSSTRYLFFVSAHRGGSGGGGGGGGGASGFELSATRCAVAATHVEVAVECAMRGGSRACRAARMRRSRAADPQRLGLPFATPLDSPWALQRVRQLARLIGTLEEGSSVVELFLSNQSAARAAAAAAGAGAGAGAAAAGYVNLSATAPATFSARLTVVVNAWFQNALPPGSSVFYGDLDPAADAAAYGADFGQLQLEEVGHAKEAGAAAAGAEQRHLALASAPCGSMCSSSTTATVAHAVQVFAPNWLWLALLVVSASALLAVGLAGSVLKRRTIVPDMLGYAASMTYNNLYVALPDDDDKNGHGDRGGGGGRGRGGGGGGVLDAMERARILREMRVCVRDVCGGEEVGRVAFTSDTDVRALENGRAYV